MEYPQYKPNSDYLPLSDDELSTLDESLAHLPSDAAMNIEAMDGYLTALLLSPNALPGQPGERWLPAIWGGDLGEDPAPFASGKQRKRIVLLVLRHLHAIACQMRDRPQAWEPIFSIAEHEEEELTDAEDWCIGFMLGADLDAEAWAPLFDDPVLTEVLRPILLLGGDDSQLTAQERSELEDAVQRDALSRSVPDAVLALHERRAATTQ